MATARHWKAISHRLTVNFEGMDLDETKEDEPTANSDLGTTAAADISAMIERPSTPTDFKPSTAQQLRLVCWKVKPWDCQKDRSLFTSIMATGWGVDCDEVHQNLFIGDKVGMIIFSFFGFISSGKHPLVAIAIAAHFAKPFVIAIALALPLI